MNIKEIAKLNNFQVINDQGYGLFDGVYWHMQETSYDGVYGVYIGLQADADFCKAVNELFKEDARVFVRDSCVIQKYGIQFDVNTRFEPQKLRDIIATVIHEGNRLGLKACAQDTGKQGDLGLYLSGRDLVIRYNEDAGQVEEQSYRQADHYLLSYLMAFIYMIPGVLAWVVFGKWIFFSGIMGYLIMYLGFKGMNKLVIRPTSSQVTHVMLMSFVMIFIANLFSQLGIMALLNLDLRWIILVSRVIFGHFDFWFNFVLGLAFAWYYSRNLYQGMQLGSLDKKPKSYKRGNHRIL